jgi:MFS superfamily sulfate permease-like transporter
MTKESVSFVLVLVVIGALYIRRRWGRSPHAYRAMIVLAIGYFVAGMLVGASLVWATYQKVGPVTSAVPAPAVVPSLKPEALAPSLAAIPLAAPPLSNYDPARAGRPDP